MKTTFLILALVSPGLLYGQSLAEVAKKEKERRESNKKSGKEAQVLSEEDLARARPPSADTGGEEGASSESASTSAGGAIGAEPGVDITEGQEGDVPANIPPDLPLEERLALFQRMKAHYETQVKEIDNSIAENDARIKKVEADLAATSAAGGAGLPVAPQTGTGVPTRPLTGQESATLAEELNRLQAMNEQLRRQKEQLKLDLQSKGRAAGIPPGYLRF